MNNQATPTIKGRTSLIVFLLIVALLFTVYIATTSTEMRNKELVDKSVKAAEDFNSLQAQKEKETKDENQAIMRNQQVFNRQSWDTFAKDVENFTAIQLQLKQLSEGSSLLAEQLLTGPEGLVLTADSPDRRTFMGMQVTLEDAAIRITQWDSLLDASSEQVKNMFSLTSITTPVERTTRESFESAYSDARRLLSELKASKLFLDNMMEQGKRNLQSAVAQPVNASVATTAIPTTTTAVTPGGTTGAEPSAANLAESLAQQEADQAARIARERQEIILQAQLDAENALREKLLEKQQEKERLLAEIEQTKLDLEIAELRQQAATAAADKIAAEKEAARKQAEHQEDLALKEELDRVKSLLAPFIARSKSRVDQHMQITYAETEAPFSLSLLTGMGALRNGEAGAESLRRAAGFAKQSGRPLGGYPLDLLIVRENYEAQQLLVKHGKAMVRAGLLDE